MTVGLALWPEQLSDDERAGLDPGVPEHLDRHPDILIVGGGIVGVTTALACTQAGLGSVVLLGLAMWFLVAMLRVFRKRGYITRYT